MGTAARDHKQNVFRDLGFRGAEAEHLLIRADLMIALERFVTRRDLTQKEAARLFQVTQPRVSDLLRGKIHLFSIDTLVEMLGRAGIAVTLTTRAKRRTA
ncbi:MAG: helix-turn-helix domain-containing protein [Gemmatimonadales bacterium]